MGSFTIKPEPYEHETFIDEDDTRNESVLRQFIEGYQSMPELWNTQHPAYTQRAVRNVAYDKLAKILGKNKRGGADRNDVRKKINTLRSNYRKEMRKVAEKKAVLEDYTYQPSNWIFHALKFLDGYEEVTPNVNDEHSLHYPYSEQHQPTAQQDFPLIEQILPPSEQSNQPPTAGPSLTPSTSTTSSNLAKKKQRFIGPIAKQNELLSLACHYLKKSKIEENIPTTAKVWAEKWKNLEPQQKLFAEKAINDVLFEATLGTLHRHSVKINEDPHYYETGHLHGGVQNQNDP